MVSMNNAMNAGDGPQSYVKNSSYQRAVLDVAKPIIEEEIATKLDILSTSSNALCIADFGCSTGHNSLPAMEIIIQAIKKKHQSSWLAKLPDIVVVLNDLSTNDFNTLFSSLPPHRNYHAAAVPGDFHRRLLPESSLHFAYSSWSLHWLTEVPKAVADCDSPAWNGGEIIYTEKRKAVRDAYLGQFGKDILSFLECRAAEMVGGGLMVLILPGVPATWNPLTECVITDYTKLMGSCLVDMAKMGRISEAKVDSFNIPYYFATPHEMKKILGKSHNFTIERMETLNNPRKYAVQRTNATGAAIMRAVHERLLTHHFGGEIIDELFHLFAKKSAALPVSLNPDNDKTIMILSVLKRKID